MLAAYSQHGRLADAVKLLVEMQDQGVAIDMISYLHMLDVCGRQSALEEGEQMHACIKRSGYGGITVVGNALVSMYGRCQSIDDAEQVFAEIPDRDVVSWNAMISAYTQNGFCKEAMQKFDLMQQAGVIPNKVTFVCLSEAISIEADLPDAKHFQAQLQLTEFTSDVVVATALITMYSKTGSLTNARASFDLLWEPNVVAWTALISGCTLNGHHKEALRLYEQMLQQGTVPDAVTYLNIIVACTSLTALNEGKRLHVSADTYGLELDFAVINGLVNMYGKCGDLVAACNAFEGLLPREVASWNVMIALHSQHGLGNEALFFLQRMQQHGVPPDRITYVTYLSACSHAGLLEEAFDCLHSLMETPFGVPPELQHFDCIVDLLGRSGLSCEAETVIEVLPFQPSPLSWMTLLTVCRNLLDVGRGENSARHVVEVDPEDHVPYVMLANIYCTVGRAEDAEHLLRLFDDTNEHLFFEEDGTNERNFLDEDLAGSFGLYYCNS